MSAGREAVCGCDGFGYPSRPAGRRVRWIRGSIASGAGSGAMDSGIQLGKRVWIRASIAPAGPVDPGIHRALARVPGRR